MLSAAGSSGGPSKSGTSKPLCLIVLPTGSTKIRSPLPLEPNDHAAVRMTSATHDISLKGPKENARLSIEVFSNLGQLEVEEFSFHNWIRINN
ncbi:hypothetical protein LguiA_014407 [Lonicera macranthoides]